MDKTDRTNLLSIIDHWLDWSTSKEDYIRALHTIREYVVSCGTKEEQTKEHDKLFELFELQDFIKFIRSNVTEKQDTNLLFAIDELEKAVSKKDINKTRELLIAIRSHCKTKELDLWRKGWSPLRDIYEEVRGEYYNKIADVFNIE